MKNLKRLGAAVVLTFVFSLSAFAGEISSPPCAPPDPGETHGPPCAAAPMASDDSTAPGEISTPLASDAVDMLTVVDAAMNLLLLF